MNNTNKYASMANKIMELSGVVRTCEEKGKRAFDKKHGKCIGTGKETERKTENQVERLCKRDMDMTKWNI